MKKFLKVFFIIIFFLLIIMVTAPILFKGKIFDVVTEQINNNVKANVSIGNLRISFFKNFPNLTIQLEELTVVGIDEFEGDTLVSFNSFVVAVDVVSAIQMENIIIKKILLDQPTINGIILEDGTANWDIAISDSTEVEEQPEEEAAGEFNSTIELNQFAIIGADISYTDYSSGMEASLTDFNFNLAGDFSQDFTVLQIESKTGQVNFLMDGIRYVKDAALAMNFNIDANLVENNYVLQDNAVAINELVLLFEGSASMPNDDDILLDMKFGTKQTTFKSILSMVPAVYMKDFETVETNGNFELEGTLKGTMNDEVTPSAYLKLLVNDAYFKYPDLPESVEKIAVNLEVNYDGVQNDNTTIDLNKFYLEIAKNPVELNVNVAKPMSDIHVNGLFKTSMDLASLSNAIPLEDTKLTGTVNASLDFLGRVVDIENEDYEKFKADGALTVSNLAYVSQDMPQGIAIPSANIAFSPKYVQVTNFDIKTGNSDIQLKGNVENFIPYVFDDQVINGVLSVNSSVLDANEFLTEEETTEEVEVAEDTTALEVIEVPNNIDFKLTTNLTKVYYDKLEIDNLEGIIWVKDGKAVLENLSMNTLEGSLALNGEYNTQDIENPMVDFGVTMDKIDIPGAFEAFVFVQKFLPVAENTSGKISTSFQLTSYLEQDMQPRMNSIVADGSFATHEISLKESGVLKKVGEALKTDQFSNLAVDDISGEFEIRNGRIYIDPFDTKIGKTKMTIGGDQGIDQTLNYTMNVAMPSSVMGAGASKLLTGLSANATEGDINMNAETFDFLVDVTGTMTDPKVKPRLTGSQGSVTETVKEEVKTVVKQEVEKKKEEVKKVVNDQADKIMAEAKKQAETVKAEAKKSAEVVRKEGYDAADRLVKEAKNPVAKKAAEVTAKKMKAETDKKADLIIKEGNEKADKIISEAQKKADALK